MKRLLALSAEEMDKKIPGDFDGVGLLRGEYICRKHEIYVTTDEWKARATTYVSNICSIYTGSPVWYRFTELETEELNVLRGVDHILPGESNPALGLRGMRRARRFPEAFVEEAHTLALVARKYENLNLLLPYVVSEDDVAFAKDILGQLGFSGSLGMMVETPASVLRLDACIDVGVDFALMGLNDLSSLTLGMNRGSSDLNFAHPAILSLVDIVAATASKRGISCGIAGYYDNAFLIEAEKRGVHYAVMHFSLLDRYLGEDYTTIVQQSEMWEIKQRTRDAIAARLASVARITTVDQG
jgi:phosphoenolpyruvate-protein kinase (PTS system EI component)